MGKIKNANVSLHVYNLVEDKKHLTLGEIQWHLREQHDAHRVQATVYKLVRQGRLREHGRYLEVVPGSERPRMRGNDTKKPVARYQGRGRKAPCPKCGGLYDTRGLVTHVPSCKGETKVATGSAVYDELKAISDLLNEFLEKHGNDLKVTEQVANIFNR